MLAVAELLPAGVAGSSELGAGEGREGCDAGQEREDEGSGEGCRVQL